VGFLLLAAKLQEVAPEIALAVDLDESEAGHDDQSCRLVASGEVSAS
jgi:hypothetical protein